MTDNDVDCFILTILIDSLQRLFSATAIVCLLVNFSSVADADYQYVEFFVSLFINNPVTADAEPVIIFLCTGQSLYVVFQYSGIFKVDE
jgi:hypothetical protein